MKKMLLPVLALSALLALAGCSENDANPVTPDAAKARGGNATVETSLVDVAAAVNADSGEFSTLIAAVLATGLDEALSAKGQRTVFAPTDAAFAKLDLNADNIGDLPTDVLTDILLYHVANGRRMAEDVVASSQIRMLNGDFTAISVMDGMAYIDEAQIVMIDVEADNGVIHVIDTVLQP